MLMWIGKPGARRLYLYAVKYMHERNTLFFDDIRSINKKATSY
jgi:hypothetical protein